MTIFVAVPFSLVLCCGGVFMTTPAARSKRAHASGTSSISARVFWESFGMSEDPLIKNALGQLFGLINPPSNDKTHYEALGRFLATFANAEGGVHIIARKLSGLSDDKARILFGGMRLADITDRIRGIIQLDGNDKLTVEMRSDIESCLDQLALISSRRHNLVHRGATYFSGGLISGNSLIAKTLASIESEIISELILNEMQSDCGVIFLRLSYVAEGSDQNAEWLLALRQRPWRYKPPPPNNKNQRLHAGLESPKRRPPSSRARREAAMKNREK